MPRVSKFIVEFIVDNIVYEAKFVHEHAHDEVGIHRPALLSKSPNAGKAGWQEHVKHVTRCQLRYKGQVVFITGEAVCVMADEYQWQRGIKLSFIRALARAGVTPDKKREQYGKFMKAFFTEMKHRGEPINVKDLPKQPDIRNYDIPTGPVPPQNQHGMGYAGAD